MYNIKVITSKDMEVIERCEEISWKNSMLKGKTFQSVGLCNQASYLVCILDGSYIIGYAALFENFTLRGNLHIAQLEVDVNYSNKSIEQSLIKFILKHSNQYKNITTDLKNKDLNRLKLFKKMGFKVLFDGGYNTRLFVETQDLAGTLNMNFNNIQDDFNL